MTSPTLSVSLSLSSSPLSSPIITPAQTAERIQRLFTPEELDNHSPTRKYVEQHLPR